MTKFSIKDVLFTTALVATGISLFGFIANYKELVGGDQSSAGEMFCVFGGCAFIGCGVMKPFHRPLWGAVLGLLAPLVVIGIAWGTVALHWLDM